MSTDVAATHSTMVAPSTPSGRSKSGSGSGAGGRSKDARKDSKDETNNLVTAQVREFLREAEKRRSDETFMALTFAATSGDIEEVRRILRRGARVNDCQYDGRTVLHMAACEGNFRVVEALLEEGADIKAVDRWGNTPMQDAINERQGLVAELLAQKGSVLNSRDPAGIMCDLASRGDVDTLKLVLENGMNPNLGDYDFRTALHLAAAEGHEKIVEYLVSKGADVNCKDRSEMRDDPFCFVEVLCKVHR